MELANIEKLLIKYENAETTDDFALSYERGETPIPCVLCNEKVKFDDLFKVAKDLRFTSGFASDAGQK